MIQYSYSINSTLLFPPTPPNSSIFYPITSPVATQQELQDDIHWWVFSVHYLSICAGYVGGSATRLDVFLECKSKPAGFTFRTDDSFILNFQRNGSQLPVLPIPLEVLHTAPPFATLVLGIVYWLLRERDDRTALPDERAQFEGNKERGPHGGA